VGSRVPVGKTGRKSSYFSNNKQNFAYKLRFTAAILKALTLKKPETRPE